jgi:hypothetical protein
MIKLNIIKDSLTLACESTIAIGQGKSYKLKFSVKFIQQNYFCLNLYH